MTSKCTRGDQIRQAPEPRGAVTGAGGAEGQVGSNSRTVDRLVVRDGRRLGSHRHGFDADAGVVRVFLRVDASLLERQSPRLGVRCERTGDVPDARYLIRTTRQGDRSAVPLGQRHRRHRADVPLTHGEALGTRGGGGATSDCPACRHRPRRGSQVPESHGVIPRSCQHQRLTVRSNRDVERQNRPAVSGECRRARHGGRIKHAKQGRVGRHRECVERGFPVGILLRG